MDGRGWFLHLMILWLIKPWMGEGGSPFNDFMTYKTMDGRVWFLHLMFLWLMHLNLDHSPLENDGPPSFHACSKETHDYNVPISKEENGFVWLTHNRVSNDNLLLI